MPSADPYHVKVVKDDPAGTYTCPLAKAPQEFGNIIIPTRTGGGPIFKVIRIKDVGRVEEGLADIRRISRTMGETAVGIGVRKQRGSNAVAVAHEVKKRLAEIQKELPPGMQLAMNFDSTRFTEDSVAEMNFTLILSAILTSIFNNIFKYLEQ